MSTKEQKIRIHWIDAVRGVTLLSMILYHAMWDAVYMYGLKIPWFPGTGAYIWQQSICWTFIFLSGFCYRFSKRPLKRGIMISCAGILIMAVTSIFVPDDRIVFGILSMIGFSYILMPIVELAFRNVPKWLGIGFSMICFILLRNVNRGYIGFEGIILAEVSNFLYCNMLTTFLGFPMNGFKSSDYFSIFPWFFLFLTGYSAGRVFDKKEEKRLQHIRKEHFIHKVGKNTLPIYLIHQPVIVIIFELCMVIQ